MHHAPYREKLEAASLNLLEKAERRMFDEHLAFCRSCEADLAAYQIIVASLVYTVEPVAPAAHLRARLYERVWQLRMDELFSL
jgi:anti-sigma factor RsiW